jgi:hypothetical protein
VQGFGGAAAPVQGQRRNSRYVIAIESGNPLDRLR